ncbi:MAG: transcription termination/antitermination protein NusG [Candidatus Dojkabacteria bacterium]
MAAEKKKAKTKAKKETKVETKPKAPKKAKKKSSGKKHLWYVINSYSGHEKKVANQIQQRVKANNLEDEISEVVVPTQEKIVVNEGKKKTIEEKIFPGYVLVKMEMNDRTWQVIRNTEGVTGFIGTGKKPTPLSPTEVKGILAFMDVKQPAYQATFSVEDAVKVVDGPFKDFVGSISEINADKGQVKVLLSVFGRETPVVLDFLQVTRL